jgi:hypothetical protein
MRITVSAASFIRCLPIGTEPVKLSLRVTGEASSVRETMSGTPNTIWATSPGSPASLKHCITAIALAGVSSLGFRITEQPAASAGEILRTGLITGKFHAQNAATGPTGCLSTSERSPGARGSTLP